MHKAPGWLMNPAVSNKLPQKSQNEIVSILRKTCDFSITGNFIPVTMTHAVAASVKEAVMTVNKFPMEIGFILIILKV